MKIRFCEQNRGKGKAYRRLCEEYPQLNIKIKSCIKKCSSCEAMPIATVDKEKVTAKNSDELYEKIRQLIDQQ